MLLLGDSDQKRELDLVVSSHWFVASRHKRPRYEREKILIRNTVLVGYSRLQQESMI
jgi:hypothetical protein